MCVDACVCVCAKLLILNGDLVMLTRNQLEVVSVFVFFVILQTLLSPRTPIIAIFPIRFRHSLDVPIHAKLKWTKKQDPRVLASEAICVDERSCHIARL